MAQKFDFYALTIPGSGLDDALHLAWIPGDPAHLLLGLHDHPSPGAALILNIQQALDLGQALQGSNLEEVSDPGIPDLSLSPANRGEPFRKGIEMRIEAEAHSSRSIFLEDYECRLIIETISKGSRA